MNKISYIKNLLPNQFLGLFLALMTGICSATGVVSEEDHRSFERRFTDLCVDKEKQDLKGSGVLLSEVISVCECIAQEESKRVTPEEVREVKEGNYPASLMMKSNAATFNCVDGKKTQPQ